MNSAQKPNWLYLVFWAGLLVFFSILVLSQSSIGKPLRSLPWIFISLANLLYFSREYWPQDHWIHQILKWLGLGLMALSFAVILRMIYFT